VCCYKLHVIGEAREGAGSENIGEVKERATGGEGSVERAKAGMAVSAGRAGVYVLFMRQDCKRS
jgi:hypothetical protein